LKLDEKSKIGLHSMTSDDEMIFGKETFDINKRQKERNFKGGY
jgi:hypothetical protein